MNSNARARKHLDTAAEHNRATGPRCARGGTRSGESFPLPLGPRGARRGEAFRLRLETGTMGHAVRLI